MGTGSDLKLLLKVQKLFPLHTKELVTQVRTEWTPGVFEFQGRVGQGVSCDSWLTAVLLGAHEVVMAQVF